MNSASMERTFTARRTMCRDRSRTGVGTEGWRIRTGSGCGTERSRAPLRATGIPGVCPTLMQGLVESRELRDSNGKLFNLCIFGKRSSLHPGTRYLARGLNDAGATGERGGDGTARVWCEADRDSARATSSASLGASESTNGVVHSPQGKIWNWSSYVWRLEEPLPSVGCKRLNRRTARRRFKCPRITRTEARARTSTAS